MNFRPASLSSPSWRRMRALIKKEFLQIVRDPSSILIAFVLPVILLFLFGYGLSLDMADIKFGIVLEDRSPQAMDLAQSYLSNRYLAARVYQVRRFAENDLIAGNIRGFLVIPEDFTETLYRRASPAEIQVISDGSEPNTAAYVENYAQGIFNNWLAQYAAENGKTPAAAVNLQPRIWFNAELESRYSLLPGCITMILAIIGTLLTALVVAREWERGTMEALMATPVRAAELLFSKIFPYFALGIGSILFSVLVSRLLFGLPLRGSLGALLLISSSFLLASLALGLSISSAAKNQFVAAQAALILAFLPSTMLSGFLFEIDSMPWLLRQVTRLVPARYFVPPLQAIFLSGDVWALILPCTATLLLMAAFFLMLAYRKSGKSLESA